MRTIFETLCEAPLQSYELFGDWSDQTSHEPKPVPSDHREPNSFVSKFDRALVQKPETEAALRRFLAKIPLDIHVFFLNSVDGLQMAQHFLDVGELSKPPSPHYSHPSTKAWNLLGDAIHERLEEKAENATVFILTHNEGGDQRHPLTPWMIIHRMVHASGLDAKLTEMSYDLGTLMQIKRAYGINGSTRSMSDDIWSALTTFRSAREMNILSPAELRCEIVTQYIVTGRVTFRPPPTIKINGDRSYEVLDNDLATRTATDLSARFTARIGEQILTLRGKILVC